MKVKDIMLHDLVAIDQDTSVKEFIYILRKCGLSSLPVVDDDDRILGIISERDIIGAVLPGYHETLRGTPFAPNPDELAQKLQSLEALTVAQFMTAKVTTVQEDEDDLYAANLMFRDHLKLMPVVNAQGRLSGLVRRIDLLKILG